MADVMNNDNLTLLGLDSQEVLIYETLLTSGSLSILELSEVIKVPRTTVYRICQTLTEKKFVQWIIDDRGKKVKAVRPDKLDFLVREKQSEVESMKEILDKLQAKFPDLTKDLPGTKVRYYRGKKGLQQMMWNSLSAKKEIFGFSVYGRVDVLGHKFLDKYNFEFKVRNLRDRVITNENSLDYIKKYVTVKRHHQKYNDIRILPKKKFFLAGDTSIYNNIYAVCFWREGEIVGVEIENPLMVKMQRSMFELLWEIAIPIEKYLK